VHCGRGKISSGSRRANGASRLTGWLAFVVLRNEAARLPVFSAALRVFGFAHFLIVDNGSDDGSADLLAAQPDVPVANAASLPRVAVRLDWLQLASVAATGTGLVPDRPMPNELLVYDQMDAHKLPGARGQLRGEAASGFRYAEMLLFPQKGPLGGAQA